MVAAPLLMLPPVPSNPSAYRRGGERRLVAAPLVMLPPVPSNPLEGSKRRQMGQVA